MVRPDPRQKGLPDGRSPLRIIPSFVSGGIDPPGRPARGRRHCPGCELGTPRIWSESQEAKEEAPLQRVRLRQRRRQVPRQGQRLLFRHLQGQEAEERPEGQEPLCCPRRGRLSGRADKRRLRWNQCSLYDEHRSSRRVSNNDRERWILRRQHRLPVMHEGCGLPSSLRPASRLRTLSVRRGLRRKFRSYRGSKHPLCGTELRCMHSSSVNWRFLFRRLPNRASPTRAAHLWPTRRDADRPRSTRRTPAEGRRLAEAASPD